MKKANESGQTVLFIMEPEEEMSAIRFIEYHKPSGPPAYWKDYTVTLEEQALRLGLRGGYDLHFHNLVLGGHSV